MTGRKNPIYQHRNAYQELPHGPMYRAITKFHADVATVEQAPYLVPQAFREAISGTRRPTHLDFDGYRGADTESARLTLPEDVYRQFLGHTAPAAPEAARADVAEAASIISAAERPMLVLGVGASEAGIGDAVRTFVDTFAIPVATSIGGRGLIETSHPKHFGALGAYSAPYANEALYEADLVIYAGCHGSRNGPFQGWSKAKRALDNRLQAAGMTAPWRLHDLRRTTATRMADLGVQPHVIEAVLNHISGHKAGVAGVYNRATYAAEKRQALDLWEAQVAALVGGATEQCRCACHGESLTWRPIG
jgi:TPP-dependent trihydroxycyclohexane-1,2-dione (THcHDO) dehydratase